MSDLSALLNIGDVPFALMGIVNVTPDSFYDGGRLLSVDDAVAHAQNLVKQGAAILDIGGASSRSGAAMVAPEEELQRVVPVIRAIAPFFKGVISVDTTWSVVAEAALDAGATWVNGTSAGRFDAGMVATVARRGATVVLMHSRGTPQTMQQDPYYHDVTAEVTGELLDAVNRFTAGGVDPAKVILDPGIGFAKTTAHTIELLNRIETLVELPYPVLLGTSRKSFIGKILQREVEQRLWGTLGSVAAAYQRGVRLFRVHDVAATRDFLEVLTAIEAGV